MAREDSELVKQMRVAAEAVRKVRMVISQLTNSLHTTGTTYQSRVKITNALDAANVKLNVAALAFDHEADLQADGGQLQR